MDAFTNDTSIDVNLMCSVCHAIFTDPYCTPCGHTFCRQCITQRNQTTCPICNIDISQGDFQPASRVLVNLIGRERMICQRCGQGGIYRENIGDHLHETCAKRSATCPAADIRCSWTGAHDQLDEHLLVCGFHSVRSLIIQLRSENQQLKQQVNTFQNHCMDQNEQRHRDIQAMKDNQSINICEFQEQLVEEGRKLNEQQTSLIDFNHQIQTMKSEIEVLRGQLARCTQEKDLITRAYHDQQTYLEQLTRKLNLMAGSYLYTLSPCFRYFSFRFRFDRLP